MKVEILNFFGGDANHANVARVSYGKESSQYTEEQNQKLLTYLAKHGHTSPFRHSTIQFRIKCPIYVERQLHKHHVGVEVNSISGRYVDFSDSYYSITQFRKQSESSKQGSGEDLDYKANNEAYRLQESLIQICANTYKSLIHLGVSKEQARSVLPLSLETEYITTLSFQAFIHMCGLRLKPDTQKETMVVVTEMLNLVKSLEGNPFKESLKAFGYE